MPTAKFDVYTWLRIAHVNHSLSLTMNLQSGGFLQLVYMQQYILHSLLFNYCNDLNPDLHFIINSCAGH